MNGGIYQYSDERPVGLTLWHALFYASVTIVVSCSAIFIKSHV